MQIPSRMRNSSCAILHVNCVPKKLNVVMIPEMVRQMLLQTELKLLGNIQYDGHMPSSYQLIWEAN